MDSRALQPRRAAATAACALALAWAVQPLPAPAQQGFADHTRGMERQDGFFPLHWDEERGRLLLEIPRPGEEFLYLTSLATGLGSNALGLDRGMIGGQYLARFDRVGPRVHLTLTNPGFRAEANPDPALVRSVEESFPTSVVASFEVLAREGDGLLVDATDFFLRDAMDVTRRFQAGGQGTFRLEQDRSAIHRPRTRAFPRNTEVEAALTFASDAPGPEVRRHTPDGRSVTLRQHHSLVRLPEPGYRPRAFDPRIGVFAVSFFDYGKGLNQDPVTRYAVRHRLQKRNPGADRSEAIEPIVYYLDPAVPEPYRAAFKEGGEWWNGVLEAAGFVDAFRIEDMPADMDPLDARYHVIQWVHRTEAGSSIGPSFRDPRTGEIIKAAVRMDSHRSLVNFNQWAGVVPATADGFDAPEAFLGAGGELDWIAGLDPDVDFEEFAMARRRQHSAHEIGHTLGLAHNFIAAADGRASVMDYPAPLIRLVDGTIDLSDAYRPGAGAYDTLAIRYAYEEFAEGEEEAGLEGILAEAAARGLRFITNPDAGAGNSHPDATWWTNGSDVLEELERVTEVRRALVDRFDETAIQPGEPMWTLQERFVPLYLHHRYTLEAAIKTLGGMEYRYGVRGDGLRVTSLVPAARQERALDLLLAALRPAELAIPEDVIGILAPRPFGHAPEPRHFEGRAGPAFDPLGVARTLADMVVGGILEPSRVGRLAAFATRDASLPTPETVIGRLVEGTWAPLDARADRREAALRRVVQRAVVDALLDLAANGEASPEAQAAAGWGLRRVAASAAAQAEGAPPEHAAHLDHVASDVRRFLDRGYRPDERAPGLRPPPGTPIGGEGG